MFQLIDSRWEDVFQKAAASHADELLIVCPYIKAGPTKRLLAHSGSASIRVLTRFSERDFFDRVSDIDALEMLLERNATIRGIKHLHAKLFVFGDKSVVAGSANLTEAAWARNHEFGFTSEQPEVIQGCRHYFDSLWSRTHVDLDMRMLNSMRKSIENARRPLSLIGQQNLQDHGQNLDAFFDPTPFESLPTRSFIKFFGKGGDKPDLDTPIQQVVYDDASHIACSYSLKKRPKQIKDGDTVFMGRFVEGDMIIYGRAIAESHVSDRGIANAEDIARRWWREHWPCYIRVRNPEFVAGKLRNGVPRSELISALGPQCFRSSMKRVRDGKTGVSALSACQQQAQVELTSLGWAWLTEALQGAFAKYGKLSDEDLLSLDWPY